MADGFRNTAGADSSTLYDPDVVGDGYNATWLKRADGSTLKYALAKYGTPGTVLGQRDSGGADVGPKWAAKGTANYALGMDGQTYISAGGRGTHTASITFNTNGTWTIAAPTSGSPLTGSWLIFGGTASDYTVQFVMSGFVSGPDPDGGSDSYNNGASSPSALTIARSCSCTASATTANTNASNSGSVTIKLYKNGSLVSTSVCTLHADAAG